jgi:predicted nucleic acid-binding protein
MGPTGPIIAVADAGPLIHLSETGRLSLMRVFDQLHIANAVWKETVDAGRVNDAILTATTTITRHTDDANQQGAIASALGLHGLQVGELAALQLCAAIPCPILVTDDLAARDAARKLQVTPVGSLGVVVRAYYRGMISLPDAEQALNDLFSISSLFVTKTIVDLAMQQLRQHPAQP